LLLSAQPVNFLKVLRRLEHMGVGVFMLTCRRNSPTYSYGTACQHTCLCCPNRLFVAQHILRC
jgi:hypothetical protein